MRSLGPVGTSDPFEWEPVSDEVGGDERGVGIQQQYRAVSDQGQQRAQRVTGLTDAACRWSSSVTISTAKAPSPPAAADQFALT